MEQDEYGYGYDDEQEYDDDYDDEECSLGCPWCDGYDEDDDDLPYGSDNAALVIAEDEADLILDRGE